MSLLSDNDLDKQPTLLGAQGELADINAVQNENIPAERIPDDVYYQIFALLAPSSSAPSADDAMDTQDADPRSVSQVSRRWRALALDSPVLWTWISLNRTLPHIQLMIQRCRNAPLRLDAAVPLTPEIRAVLAPHADRVRSVVLRKDMDLEDDEGDEDATMLLRIVAASPVLDSLSLSEMGVYYGWCDPEPVPPPALRYLHILDSVPSGESPLLRPLVRHITDFTLSCPTEQFADGLDWKELFILLGYMPSLERLTISDTDLEPAHDCGRPYSEVALPRLRLFRAERVDARFLRYLLIDLKVPATTEFRFVHQGSGIPRLARSPFRGARRLTIARVPGTHPGQHSVLLSAHRPGSSARPRTELLVPEAIPEKCLRELGRATAYVRLLRTVEVVGFGAADAANGARELVQHAGKCATLRLTRCAPALLSAVLAELRGGGQQQGSSPEEWACPALERVEIRKPRLRDAAQARELLSAVESVVDSRRSAAGDARIRVTVIRSQLFGEVFEDVGDLRKRLEQEQ